RHGECQWLGERRGRRLGRDHGDERGAERDEYDYGHDAHARRSRHGNRSCGSGCDGLVGHAVVHGSDGRRGPGGQLRHSLRDGAGRALLGRAVAWSSSNTGVATVSGTGLVSGVAAGSATITATSEGVRGTAALTVTAVSSGGTVLLQENFADGAFSARGWYDTPDMPVTSAQHMPGATSALEIHMPPGAVYGQFGSAARHAFTPTPSLYVSYWVK